MVPGCTRERAEKISGLTLQSTAMAMSIAAMKATQKIHARTQPTVPAGTKSKAPIRSKVKASPRRERIMGVPAKGVGPMIVLRRKLALPMKLLSLQRAPHGAMGRCLWDAHDRFELQAVVGSRE